MGIFFDTPSKIEGLKEDFTLASKIGLAAGVAFTAGLIYAGMPWLAVGGLLGASAYPFLLSQIKDDNEWADHVNDNPVFHFCCGYAIGTFGTLAATRFLIDPFVGAELLPTTWPSFELPSISL